MPHHRRWSASGRRVAAALALALVAGCAGTASTPNTGAPVSPPSPEATPPWPSIGHASDPPSLAALPPLDVPLEELGETMVHAHAEAGRLLEAQLPTRESGTSTSFRWLSEEWGPAVQAWSQDMGEVAALLEVSGYGGVRHRVLGNALRGLVTERAADILDTAGVDLRMTVVRQSWGLVLDMGARTYDDCAAIAQRGPTSLRVWAHFCRARAAALRSRLGVEVSAAPSCEAAPEPAPTPDVLVVVLDDSTAPLLAAESARVLERAKAVLAQKTGLRLVEPGALTGALAEQRAGSSTCGAASPLSEAFSRPAAVWRVGTSCTTQGCFLSLAATARGSETLAVQVGAPDTVDGWLAAVDAVATSGQALMGAMFGMMRRFSHRRRAIDETRLRADTLTTLGGLTPPELEESVRGATEALARCGGSLGEITAVTLKIDRRGRVVRGETATLDRGAANAPAPGRCVERVVRGLRFPQSSRARRGRFVITWRPGAIANTNFDYVPASCSLRTEDRRLHRFDFLSTPGFTRRMNACFGASFPDSWGQPAQLFVSLTVDPVGALASRPEVLPTWLPPYPARSEPDGGVPGFHHPVFEACVADALGEVRWPCPVSGEAAEMSFELRVGGQPRVNRFGF